MTPAFQIDVLSRTHHRAAFDCAFFPLNDYLKKQASQDLKRRIAQVYVATSPPSLDVIGYYTLSATHIELNQLPQDQRQKLPHYPYVPAVLLGRLAVDQNYQRQKLGRLLLLDALHKCLHSTIGATALFVEVQNERALLFYKRYGFQALKDHPSQLFLPLQQISSLF